MALHNRLAISLDDAGMKAADLARSTKLSRATISDWLSGKTQRVQATHLLIVSKALGVNYEWLLTGQGPMHHDAASSALPPKHRALIGLFDGLTETQQEEVIRELEDTKQSNDQLYAELSQRRKAG